MFDVLSRYFSVVFGLTFLASFVMAPEATIDEKLIISMKIGAIVTVVIGLCVNWRDYNG
jgi:hypothetical protein